MRLALFFHHARVASEQSGRPLPDVLRLCRDLGVESVVLDPPDVVPDTLSALSAAGIGVSSVPVRFDFASPSFAPDDRTLDLLRAAGAPQLLAIPTPFPAAVPRADTLRRVADGLAALSARCRAAGLVVTIENFDSLDSPCCDPADVGFLLESVPNLGLCLDTGNVAILDQSPLPLCERWADRVVHVHAKDRLPAPDFGDSPLVTASGRRLYPGPVGSGEIPFAAIFARLREAGVDDVPVALEFYNASRMLDCIVQSAEWFRAYANGNP